MEDDWGEPSSYTPCTQDKNNIEATNYIGRSFGKGRGFVPQGVSNDPNENTWGNENGSFRSDRGDRRGRGGRGRHRGRGGENDRFRNRRNYNNDSFGGHNTNGDNGWSNEKANDDWNSSSKTDLNKTDIDGGVKEDEWNRGGSGFGNREGGRSGRRGGRRGGRNSDFESNNNGDNENGDGEKRRPVYVPKERTEDELFEESGVTKGINFDDYKNIQVNVSGDNVPPPISSFAEANFRELILKNLKRSEYDEPTPIQKYSIPIIMNGRDLMGTAQTGSGKTAAFLLPIIHKLLDDSNPPNNSSCVQPFAVVLSPTRELTTQIFENARKFCYGSYLKVHQVYGGTSISYQIRQIQNGCHILIATPGRLGDFLNRSILNFNAIKFVVLDEADRMLDMGFRGEIEKFLNHSTMPTSCRQTLMFSATFSQDIQKMASQYLSDHLFLAVGIIGGACKDVEQHFIEVSRNEKKRRLKELLNEQDDVTGTLLFVETKRNADFVASYLSSQELPTTSIHGDRYQSQREEALRDFKSRRMSILVATSVAARGLDIKGVKHVINFDLPDSVDEYVHRIGRTGRLGNQGKATSFYDSSQDSRIANDLVSILTQAGQPVPDFLKNDATGMSSFTDNKFGGYDYRSKNSDAGGFKTGLSNNPVQIQEEETW